MLYKSDLARVYDTVLSIPGMNEVVKIELRIPRKNVLLLSRVIERGLAVNEGAEDEASGVMEIMPEETLQQLGLLAAEMLQKAGLTEMNDKLKAF